MSELHVHWAMTPMLPTGEGHSEAAPGPVHALVPEVMRKNSEKSKPSTSPIVHPVTEIAMWVMFVGSPRPFRAYSSTRQVPAFPDVPLSLLPVRSTNLETRLSQRK